MAPRRAAAVSAASSISQAAGPSTTLSVHQPKVVVSQGRSSLGSKQAQQNAKPTVAVPIIPVQPLSPIISRLRKMWKFAAICQFLFTFDEAFGMSGFETEALENDLDGSEKKVVPDLFRRLLYTLTLNRNIDEYNWEEHLRAQYLARQPEENVLGTAEEPFPWAALPLRQKIETLHQACEWQLWDAERFRKLVKNDDDAHVWRIDPIGWDSNDNTYWLFDDNHLWIQYPRPAPVKAKAPPKKNSKKAKQEAAAARRAATASQASQKRKREEAKPKSTPTRSSARNRTISTPIETPASKRGRSSRRSHGKDEWEEIPPELLYGEGNKGRLRDDDEDSELSDPPPAEEEDVSMVDEVKVEDINNTISVDADADDDAEEDMKVDLDVENTEEVINVNGKHKEGEEIDEAQKIDKPEEIKAVEEDEWIEFETIAVTKQEWEAISTRFAKSKHPDEKSLHQLLHSEVLPKVMEDLAEAEKQRALEAAMANRKRSSRIALKESEREEKERDRVARLKMEEKMAGIRAEEAQKIAKEKEEKDLAKLREERLREREDRMAAREREAIERAEKEIMERENREKMREMRKMKREQILANGGLTNESQELQQHKEEDQDSWELKCEVCGKAGINLEDTDEIVCCEICGRWQHTECWNNFDRSVGRPNRDWEKEDFFCSDCKPPAPGQARPRAVIKQAQQDSIPPAAAVASPTVNKPVSVAAQAIPSPSSAQPPTQSNFVQQQRPLTMQITPLHPNMHSTQNMYPSSPNLYGQGQQRSPQQQMYSLQQQQQQQQQQHQHQYQPVYSQQRSPQYPMQSQQPLQQRSTQYPTQSQQSSVAYPVQSQQPSSQFPQQYLQQSQQRSPQPSLQYSMQSQQRSPQHPTLPQQPSHLPYTMQSQQPPPQSSPQPSSQYSIQSQQPSPQPQSQYSMQSQQPSSRYTMQSQQSHQPSPQSYHPQTPQYPQSTQGYGNGYQTMSNSQTHQKSPVMHSQIPPQHMQRPPPPPAVQSPSEQVQQSQPRTQSSSSSSAYPSNAGPKPLPLQSSTSNGTRMDMPAPLPSNQGGSHNNAAPVRPSGVPSSPQVVAPSASSSPRAPNVPSLSQASPSSIRSTTPSPKASPNVPRNIANMPSGSFPLRNSTGRSPLSRPDDYTPPSIPTMNLGPSVGRATSPSPIKKSPNSNTKLDPLLNRQTVPSVANTSSTSTLGPGPSSGSLARSPPSSGPLQTTNSTTTQPQIPSSSPSQSQSHSQQHVKTLGPSPSRPVFGAEINGQHPPTNSTAPSSLQSTPQLFPPSQQQQGAQQSTNSEHSQS